MSLEAAILAYLTAQGERFARTVAAFKEEAMLPDDGSDNAAADQQVLVSGAVLERAWVHARHDLMTNDEMAFFDAIKSGDLAEVQLYVSSRGEPDSTMATTMMITSTIMTIMKMKG